MKDAIEIETVGRCIAYSTDRIVGAIPTRESRQRWNFMGDLINLNKFRKAKQRQAEEDQAAINREKFGRTKAETKQSRRSREQDEKALDAKKLEREGRNAKDHDADKDKR